MYTFEKKDEEEEWLLLKSHKAAFEKGIKVKPTKKINVPSG